MATGIKVIVAGKSFDFTFSDFLLAEKEKLELR
jgi:hypothetical protein